jgi:CzcA family heavy metal efflux pump
MMRWIVNTSLQFRVLVLVIAALLMVIGFSQLSQTPLDLFPEFELPYVEIQTEALGLSAQEVEAMITVPLEADMLNGVAWLKTIRSESLPGLSSIVLIFEKGTDILAARQVVQERLIAIHALPNVSKPPTMKQPLSSTSRVMSVALSSSKLSLIDLSVLARWTIQPRLLGVPGVANVSIWGQRKRQLQVQIDPDNLHAQGVSLKQVISSTGNALWASPLTFLEASTPGTSGWIDTPNQRLGVRHLLPITTPEQLAEVAVEGTALHLGDVAKVVEDHQPLIGDAIVDDEPGLLLVVERFPWANTLAVTEGVEDALESLRPGLSGVTINPAVFRPATFIEMAIDNLRTAFIVAIILVLLVLAVFLYNIRVAIISIVAIPLSLLAAFIVFHLRGVALNTMILAGFVIAIGAVVDDAIIDVENIVRRLRQRRQEGSTESAARIILEASLEMRGAMVFATLILVLAVLPVAVMEGLTGAFFRPLVFSYILAVIASMAVALTVTPALSAFLLSGTSLEPRTSPVVTWLQQRYEAALTRIVQAPMPAYGIAALLFIIALVLLPFLGQSLFPAFSERDLLVNMSGAPGTSQSEMSRLATQAGRELKAIPGVRGSDAHVGRAVMSDQVVNVNNAEIWVNVDPEADYDATVAAVRDKVAAYPGLQRDVLTYLQAKIRRALTGSREAIVVRIYGHELDMLRSKAEEVRQALSKVDGLVDAHTELQIEEPVIEIEADLARSEPYGIKPGDIRRTVAAYMSGIQVGALYEEQKVFDVIVWSTPETRNSVSAVRELPIETADGGYVRLADVADVRIAPSPNVIKRESVSRRIDVTANVSGRDLGSVARDVASAIKTVDFPLEYHAELLGEYAERQAAQQRLVSFSIAAIIGIFLLLQACFNSWRLATISFVALILALVGGVIASVIDGGVISIGSLVGFLTVLGLSARGGIMLFSHFQHLEHCEGQAFGLELIVRGARERLAPIVTTALTTGLVLLPFVVAGSAAGYEIEHPMAVVILGGLITATWINLFVLPALYLQFGEGTQPAGMDALMEAGPASDASGLQPEQA